MPIQLIHVSDIHLGSGESHGKINPETGLNIRFEDFALALEKVVDYAMENQADVFLFSGDAYKNATPEPAYQKAFARQLKRLSNAEIPTVLLVGNHDLILRSGTSHAMSVFQTLEVPNLIVIDRPTLITISTKNGKLQVFGIPYVTRHLLMTDPEFASSTESQIDASLVAMVGEILQGAYERLDPAIPAVVTAHAMVDRARAGAEQELMIGRTLTFPLEFFVDPRVDYVALGHVHTHQLLRRQSPVIAYAGSLERVDFSEESQDKGFIHADIQKGHVDVRFHSVDPRPFVTVECDLTDSSDPTLDLLSAAKAVCLPGCVLRLSYRIQQSRFLELDERRLKDSLTDALVVKFRPTLVMPERPPRMPEITERAAGAPLALLEKYLDQLGLENKEELLRKASALYGTLEEHSSSRDELD